MATNIALYKKVNNDWVEVTANNRATVLEPNDELKLTCSTDLALSNLRIKIAVGGTIGAPETEEIVEQEFTESNEFILSEFYVTSHNISFVILQIADEGEGEWTDVSGALINLSNYNYPLDYSIEEISFVRMLDDYTDTNPNGPYVGVNKILFSLNSGVIADIQSVLIRVYKNNEKLDEDIELQNDLNNNITIILLMFSSGYSDSNTNYLFDTLNNTDMFIDINSKFYFSFTIKYTKLATSTDLNYNTEVVTLDESNRYSLRNSITSLYLVGKTELDNGNNVYGGVSIGKEPNIKNIGLAAFECGYPAYFTNNTYFKGYRYGFFSGDKININFLSGYITGSSGTMSFYYTLGLTIYANTVKLSGIVRVRTVNKYVNGYSYDSPKTLSNVNLIIIDRKCGIVRLDLTNSNGFRIDGNSGTKITNNTPINMAPHSGNITLTFS